MNNISGDLSLLGNALSAGVYAKDDFLPRCEMGRVRHPFQAEDSH